MTETAIEIRAAYLDDAEMIWRWRNAPDVRAASLSTEAIPFENHLAWFKAALEDPLKDIFIAEQNDRPIGMVRFDADRDVADVNILIDPSARGLGLANLVLTKAIANLSINSRILRATVKSGNSASLALFRSAGFRATKSGELYVFERERGGQK